MNYVKESEVFREWLLFHELPSSAIGLWHTLMNVNNAKQWGCPFGLPNGIAQQLTGLSKSSLHEARKKLVDHGLINYHPGDKGNVPAYGMISLLQKSETFVD